MPENENAVGNNNEKGIEQRQLVLTQSQQEVRGNLLGALRRQARRTPDRARAYVIHGMPGIGKSTLIESLETSKEVRSGQVTPVFVEPETLFSVQGLEELAAESARPIITSATPFELESIHQANFKSRSPISIMSTGIRVHPMNSRETRAYLDTIDNRSELSNYEITDFSMGIPQLVQQLTASGVDKDSAYKIVANYLHRSIPPGLSSTEITSFFEGYVGGTSKSAEIGNIVYFLQKFPLETLTPVQVQKGIYFDLETLENRREALRTQGVHEESPRFVSIMSKLIYDQITANQADRRNHTIWIHLYAPELDDADVQRITQAFDPGSHPQNLVGSRLEMFGLSSLPGKVGLELRFPDGAKWTNNQIGFVRDNPFDAQSFLQGKYPLSSHDRSKPSLFVADQEHGVSSTIEAVKLFQSVETLLQQRGCDYLVSYNIMDSGSGVKYVYKDGKLIPLNPQKIVSGDFIDSPVARTQVILDELQNPEVLGQYLGEFFGSRGEQLIAGMDVAFNSNRAGTMSSFEKAEIYKQLCQREFLDYMSARTLQQIQRADQPASASQAMGIADLGLLDVLHKSNAAWDQVYKQSLLQSIQKTGWEPEVMRHLEDISALYGGIDGIPDPSYRNHYLELLRVQTGIRYHASAGIDKQLARFIEQERHLQPESLEDKASDFLMETLNRDISNRLGLKLAELKEQYGGVSSDILVDLLVYNEHERILAKIE